MKQSPVKRIVDAWVIEGRNPAYHRKMQRLVRRSMPLLANAIEALVEQESVHTPSDCHICNGSGIIENDEPVEICIACGGWTLEAEKEIKRRYKDGS